VPELEVLQFSLPSNQAPFLPLIGGRLYLPFNLFYFFQSPGYGGLQFLAGHSLIISDKKNM